MVSGAGWMSHRAHFFLKPNHQRLQAGLALRCLLTSGTRFGLKLGWQNEPAGSLITPERRRHEDSASRWHPWKSRAVPGPAPGWKQLAWRWGCE